MNPPNVVPPAPPAMDPFVYARQVADQAMADAKVRHAAITRDYEMAAGKGDSAEIVAARRRMAQSFVDIHFHGDSAETKKELLERFDYHLPMQVVNAQGLDPQAPISSGFLGMGRKQMLLLSKSYPSKKPEEPVYALRYYPVHNAT